VSALTTPPILPIDEYVPSSAADDDNTASHCGLAPAPEQIAPPLDPETVQAVINAPHTEMGMRDRVLALGPVRHVEGIPQKPEHGWGLIVWDNGWWQSKGRATCALSSRLETVYSILRDETARLTDAAAATPDEVQKKQIEARARVLAADAKTAASQRAQVFTAKLINAHRASYVEAEEVDCNPYLLGLADGNVVDLNRIRPVARSARPQDLVTKRANVAWDGQARCPLWLAFLEQAQPDPEMRAYLQRWAGYIATAGNREDAWAVVQGEGGTGKSTFSETLAWALGDYAETILPSVLMGENEDAGTLDSIAHLKGARFVTLSEPPEWRRQINAATMKRLVGHDRLQAKFLYGHTFRFEPTFKVWIYTNTLPGVYDTTDGFWRRTHVIPFDHKPATVDVDLQAKLRGERGYPGEGSGILNWILEGVRAYRERGSLDPPQLVRERVAEWRYDQDRIGAFLDECCALPDDWPDEPLDSFRVHPGAFYATYSVWANSHGMTAMASQKFKEELKRFGIRETRRGPRGQGTRERRIEGVRLLPDLRTDYNGTSI
jgi:putative DNA primase/helicase